MAKFRSKPTEIEATQWFKPGDHPGVTSKGKAHFVQTAGGEAEVFEGDWIINEVAPGKFYPCRPDIFAKKYEPV